MHQPIPIEKGIFKITFRINIPVISIESINDFGNILLDVSQLKINNLTELAIQDITIQVLPEPKNRYFIILATFEESIRKAKDKYKTLHETAIKRDDSNNKYTSEYKSLFIHLAGSLLKYIIWRKNLSTNSQFVINNNAITYNWTIDSIEGMPPEPNKWYAIGDAFEVESEDQTITGSDFIDFYKLYNPENIAIPLHKELLFEAETLIRNNQLRSAVVLLCAAIEVGTKTLISHVNPNSAWLLENLPSPDIYKIHKDYIPQIINPIIKGNDLDMLRNLINVRNIVVHTGKSTNYEFVQKQYFFIKRILYRIDSCINFDWASDIKYPSVDFLL